jgi:hypothetical protein
LTLVLSGAGEACWVDGSCADAKASEVAGDGKVTSELNIKPQH